VSVTPLAHDPAFSPASVLVADDSGVVVDADAADVVVAAGVAVVDADAADVLEVAEAAGVAADAADVLEAAEVAGVAGVAVVASLPHAVSTRSASALRVGIVGRMALTLTHEGVFHAASG
jgi:hypothetical protein